MKGRETTGRHQGRHIKLNEAPRKGAVKVNVLARMRRAAKRKAPAATPPEGGTPTRQGGDH